MAPSCATGRARVNTAARRSAQAAPDASPRPCTRLAFAHLHHPRRANSSSTALRSALAARRVRASRQPTPTPTPRRAGAAARGARGAARRSSRPTHSLREADPTRLDARRSRGRASTCATLDDAIARGARASAGSRRSGSSRPTSRARARRNPTYAVDPYTLARGAARERRTSCRGRSSPSRSPRSSARWSRCRRARAVLVPVELRFEQDRRPGREWPCCTLALLDGRARRRPLDRRRAERSRRRRFSPALLASLAAHLADLIAAP